jgi:hypothetical protein
VPSGLNINVNASPSVIAAAVAELLTRRATVERSDWSAFLRGTCGGKRMTTQGIAEDCDRDTRRFQFSRLAFILVGTALVFALIFILPAWRVAYLAKQEFERRQMTKYSFKLTWHALSVYNAQNGQLPFPVRCDASGRPLYSWRGTTALLTENWFPHAPDGSWDATKPWDDPSNRQLADFPQRFCYDGLIYWGLIPDDYSRETCQMAITGPDTAFGGDGTPPKSLQEIADDTILVVESRSSGIHWMKPGDFDIGTMPRTISGSNGLGISSRYRDGFHVLFADGEVWFISNRVPFQTLEMFFTLTGAEAHDRENALGPFLLDRLRT